MKRALFLLSLTLTCIALTPLAFSQSNTKSTARSNPKKRCPFSIIGLWRSSSTTQTNPIFFNFSPEGWMALLGHSAEALPQDFEIITAVSYKLDKPAAPSRIEITTSRGNDAFLPGTTLMDILEYDDESFTTRDRASGQESQWLREQTHRYFLTLAARSATPPLTGPAFGMLTTLDGRQTKVEALGIHIIKDAEARSGPVFGRIPEEIYTRFTDEDDVDKNQGEQIKSKKDETVVMRLELTAAEFERTHSVFDVWDRHVKARSLPHRDPSLNTMEFLTGLIDHLNQCGEKLKVNHIKQSENMLATEDNRRQQTFELVRAIRKKNDQLHLPERSFPWGWRPSLLPER